MDLEQEKTLVERAKTDPQAFGVLYDEYYGKIFGYILRRTASVASAQDMTSEVFFKALSGIKSFQWRGIPFSAWLYRIAENEIAKSYIGNGHDRVLSEELKRELDMEESSFEADVTEAENELQKQADLLAVHACLSQLPARYQEVIALRFYEKKQINEIAQILGKREGTVKSLLHRGLEKLKVLLEKDATF